MQKKGKCWFRSLILSIFVLSPMCALASGGIFDDLGQDASFKSAIDEVAGLRMSVEDFQKELSILDNKSKSENDGALDEKYKSARQEMVKIIQSIDTSSLQMAKLLKKLYAYKSQLNRELANLKETQANLEVGKQYLNQLLLLVYKMQREIYDENGETVDELKVFMKSSDTAQLLVGNDTLQALLAQINDLLKQASAQQKQKTAMVEKLTQLRAESQKALQTYSQEIETLQQKKEYLQHFMKLYKEKKWAQISQEGAAAELKLLEAEITKHIKQILAKKYKSDTVAQLISQLQSQTDSSEKENSPLAWPAYPVNQILTIFKDPDFELEYGFKHLGVQMAVEQRTPVYAMRDGVVYALKKDGDGIYWVLIVHTDGYITVYQYLNEIAVEEGDMLRRGQFIGKSGGDSGTNGAGFLSKSPNLTFQIYKDGVAIDPLTVLDLSVVVDIEKVLPEEYRLKYFNDQYIRPIDVSNLVLIKGETVDERSQTFLNSYAVGAYRSVSFWDQVVAGTNIDRDIVICIGFAESTLGRFLSTSNNIGNVGNNDRGDRIAYNNPYNGARLIPLTLNNQYLGGYHTIKQLSRYGNEDGKIYASSPINRQSNVQKCLSKIKGFYVPEDYPFRTGVNPNKKSDTTDVVNLQTEKAQIMQTSKQTKIGGVKVE